MAAPIDPPRNAVAPVVRLLAEAALQRQSTLLGTDKPAAAAVRFPDPGTLPPTPTSPPLPSNLPLPLAADKATISAQAREQLDAGRAGLPSSTGGSGGRGAGAAPALPGVPAGAPSTAAAVPVASLPWPAGGIGAPLMRMVGALVQQLTQHSAVPARVVAAQAWPAAMQEVIDGADAGQALPPLQNWLVGQGAVQTADGARGIAMALQVPVAWAKSVPPSLAGQAPVPAAALAAPFTGPPQALASGLFALVLQPLDPGGARTSALLALEVTPWLGANAATVYGRDLLQVRNDPWLHMALQQASGQWREEEEAALRRGGSEPCHTVGCPYAGRAPCEQPFCMALRVQSSQPASSAP